MTDCVDAMVMRGVDDWLHPADLVDVLISVAGRRIEEDLREPGMAVLRELLTSDLMRIGDVTRSGFVPWQLSVEAALSKVESEWRALGKNPSFGDLFWLANTDAGERRGGKLLSEWRKSRSKRARL